jgi:hypothetical protein
MANAGFFLKANRLMNFLYLDFFKIKNEIRIET